MVEAGLFVLTTCEEAGPPTGLEFRLTNTEALGIFKTWFLLSHASTDPLINASW